MHWRSKLLAKIILSRIPLAYRTWRKLGLFRHGSMNAADYSIAVVSSHIERVGGAERIKGAVCLEIGPGDSLATALIAHAFGARKTILVDVGDFADRNLETYRQLADTLSAQGHSVIDISNANTLEEFLRLTNSEYLTNGIQSINKIDSKSVDYIWSQAVLEHVRVHELDDLFKEFRRIIKSNGAMSHRIDFKDHLAASLNNLRFSRVVWESEFMSRSGFYTNRVRYSEMLRKIVDAGFEVQVLGRDMWDEIPVSRTKLADEFRRLSDEDLRVAGADILAHPA